MAKTLFPSLSRKHCKVPQSSMRQVYVQARFAHSTISNSEYSLLYRKQNILNLLVFILKY